MVIHVISQRHFSRTQQTRPVVWYRRMRGDTPNTYTHGEWYGSRAPDDRSVPRPTSAHRESLCRQDWLGRGHQSYSANGDGHRSRDHCTGHDSRYLEWTESPLTFRTLCRRAEAFLGSTLKTGSGSQSMRRL